MPVPRAMAEAVEVAPVWPAPAVPCPDFTVPASHRLRLLRHRRRLHRRHSWRMLCFPREQKRRRQYHRDHRQRARSQGHRCHRCHRWRWQVPGIRAGGGGGGGTAGSALGFKTTNRSGIGVSSFGIGGSQRGDSGGRNRGRNERSRRIRIDLAGDISPPRQRWQSAK